MINYIGYGLYLEHQTLAMSHVDTVECASSFQIKLCPSNTKTVLSESSLQSS